MAKKEKDLVEIFKRRTRHPFRPRASHIIDRLFPDFEDDGEHGRVTDCGILSF